MITKQIGSLLVAGDYKTASDAEPFFTVRAKSGNRLRQWTMHGAWTRVDSIADLTRQLAEFKRRAEIRREFDAGMAEYNALGDEDK